MTTSDDLVVLGIDWADPEHPVLRTAPVGTDHATTSALVGPLSFRVVDERAFCCGWFDLTGPEPTHVVCESWERPDRGTQCRKCQYREGFITAHQSHRATTALPSNVRDYLAQPHLLYVDIFAEGTTKVGTVAQSRLAARLAEQGAVAARYVARISDGAAARSFEAAVSSRLGLTQLVATSRKVKALASRVDVDQLANTLDQRVADIATTLKDLASDRPGVEVLDEPLVWDPPQVAVGAFASTPVPPYPAAIGEGEHGLHIRSAAGPVAVFASTADSQGDLYAANLAALRGRRVQLGDFTSSLAPTQVTLF